MKIAVAAILAILASSPLLATGITDNDSSCDIGLYPAATLLLPYFEVDLGLPGGGNNTIFSITNVSALPQIAHVTLWTDWAYPVLDFSIFLTGYDVQPINLYDVLVRGVIAPPNGTSTSSPNARTKKGEPTNPSFGTQPLTNLANPNFLAAATTDCAALPGPIPPSLAADVRALLASGRSPGAQIGCPLPGGQQAQVGGNHGARVAIGYATIDVVATCSRRLPTDPQYMSGDLLFDNVLTGDYEQLLSGGQANGGPLVHIRAVPEGGGAGSTPFGVTDLPFTFYDRYTAGQPDRRIDRRQPLPSAFAARWISSGSAFGGFETHYEIWREGVTGSSAACDDYVVNSAIPVTEIVRYDERENAGVQGYGIIIPEPVIFSPSTPATSRFPVTSAVFPVVPGSTDVGGWVYMNMSNGGTPGDWFGHTVPKPYSSARAGFGQGSGSGRAFPRDVSQSWVRARMTANGAFNTAVDATALGNGCSPALPAAATATDPNAPAGHIGPAGGVVLCPPGTAPTNGDRTACIGSNVTP